MYTAMAPTVSPTDEVLVTKILADAGYDCGLAGKLHLSRAKDRVEKRPDDGYRVFHWSHHPMQDWPEGHAYADWLRDEKNVDPDELFLLCAAKSTAPECPRNTIRRHGVPRWQSASSADNRDGPWLMSVNPFDPHPPFDPPAEYLERYVPEDLPYPLFEEQDVVRQKRFEEIDQQTRTAVNPRISYGDEAASVDRNIDTAAVPPPHYDARKVKACYYGMIELIDRQFGRIIDALKATDQLANTIIVFTSDHGELLGDHGLHIQGLPFL